jgi:hypothetical protein
MAVYDVICKLAKNTENKACSCKAKHFDFQYGDDDGVFGIYSKRKKNWTVLV